MAPNNREKFTTTINKDLLNKVKKRMIDKDIKNANDLIEELFRNWLRE